MSRSSKKPLFILEAICQEPAFPATVPNPYYQPGTPVCTDFLGTVEPALFDEDPHPWVGKLQERVVGIILAHLGIASIPGVLLALLRTKDSFTAVCFFVEALDFRGGEPLLSELLAQIAAVEPERAAWSLSAYPLYEAVATHDSRVVAERVAAIKQVDSLLHLLSTLEGLFPRCSEFAEQVTTELSTEWATLSEAELFELSQAATQWQEHESRYQALRLRCEELLASAATELDQQEFLQCEAVFLGFQAAVAKGDVVSLDDLESLCAYLEDALPQEDSLVADLRLLELEEDLFTTSADPLRRVKRAYRRLAKVYHPDNQSSGNPQRFMELQTAYERLVQYSEQTYNQKAS